MTEPRQTATSSDGTPIAYTSLGEGEGVIVLGGALRTAEDYLPFARELARNFEVHVVDRRGRGASGPQGDDYSIERECEDLRAVQRATGATRVFGHSYGGLVALEAAPHMPAVCELAVYEPGISVNRSIPTGWLPRYEQLLDAGDSRGAFAHFVRQSGHAPPIVQRLPLAYLRVVLRTVIRKREWRRMEPLLGANLVEHREVARLDGTLLGYSRITARCLLLWGTKSPRASTAPLRDLNEILANSTTEILEGLGHTAPEEADPARVARSVARFFGANRERP